MKRAAVHPRVIEKEKCSFRWRRRRRSPDICGQSRPFLVLIEIRQENTARHVHAKWQPSLLPYSNKKSRLDKFEKIDPSHYSIFLSLGKGKMNQYEKELYDFLEHHAIPYRVYAHQPVFTVFEEPVVTSIDGAPVSNATIPPPHFKSLFLVDQRGLFFLVTLFGSKRLYIKRLREILACGRLSFGKAEELIALLKITPGAVTPFGLLFDQKNQVTFALDEESLSHETVCFHPMRNDKTLLLSTQDFLKCMQLMHHSPKMISIPQVSSPS